jgi:hypothetical protein
MSERRPTVDFGAPTAFGVHVFRVIIPRGQTPSVVIVEDYGYRHEAEGKRQEERVHLTRARWSAISEVAKREFNERLKAAKIATGRWHTDEKGTLVERMLGGELCVLAWAAETASPAQMDVITSKWAALRPEERWWLFSMTVAECGLPQDRERGWRRALYFALSDGQTRKRRNTDNDLFSAPSIDGK